MKSSQTSPRKHSQSHVPYSLLCVKFLWHIFIHNGTQWLNLTQSFGEKSGSWCGRCDLMRGFAFMRYVLNMLLSSSWAVSWAPRVCGQSSVLAALKPAGTVAPRSTLLPQRSRTPIGVCACERELVKEPWTPNFPCISHVPWREVDRQVMCFVLFFLQKSHDKMSWKDIKMKAVVLFIAASPHVRV